MGLLSVSGGLSNLVHETSYMTDSMENSKKNLWDVSRRKAGFED